MIVQPDYPWYVDPLSIFCPYPCYFYPTTHGISNTLPMLFWPPSFQDILIPYPWYFNPLTHGILNPIPMLFWQPGPWCKQPPIHGILTPYPWYFDPSIHGILIPYPWHINHLPMVVQPDYPWYFDPLSIFCTLSMLFLPAYLWYIEHPTYAILTHLPMVFCSPLDYKWGRQHTIVVQFTIQGIGFQ